MTNLLNFMQLNVCLGLLFNILQKYQKEILSRNARSAPSQVLLKQKRALEKHLLNVTPKQMNAHFEWPIEFFI